MNGTVGDRMMGPGDHFQEVMGALPSDVLVIVMLYPCLSLNKKHIHSTVVFPSPINPLFDVEFTNSNHSALHQHLESGMVGHVFLNGDTNTLLLHPLAPRGFCLYEPNLHVPTSFPFFRL